MAESVSTSRVINPVVVAPTIAAVGLSFYSYGFPQVGTCLEIGAVQILLVIIFSLVSNDRYDSAVFCYDSIFKSCYCYLDFEVAITLTSFIDLLRST